MKLSVNKEQVAFYLWLCLGYFLLGLISTYNTYAGRLLPLIINHIWAVVYVAAINFSLFEYTIPFVLNRKRFSITHILFAVFLSGGYLFLYTYGSWGWRWMGTLLHAYTPLKTFASSGAALQNQLLYSAGSIFFFGVSRHIFSYIKLKQTSQQLRIEKQEAELNYLRSQTNPHFLFNTLNNIYSLAKDKSDVAPEAILRLSKILRFMLYETDDAFITVEQELQMIQDYVALEQLRYDDTLFVDFNYEIEDTKQFLPPLLLMPLVENAFKHGVSETRGKPFIKIQLSLKQGVLNFVVANSTEEWQEEIVKENIGLSNLRRQLQLLYTDYQFSAQQEKDHFTATLHINLASHV